MKQIMRTLAVLIGLGVGRLLHAAEVEVPAAINYQGRLTQPADGSPVDSGLYSIAFRIWDDPTSTDSAALIWGRTFPVHVVTNGIFNVLLSNDGQPLTDPAPAISDLRQAFVGADRYLGLQIVQTPSGPITAPELSPRQQLVSSPYALYAQNATDAHQATHADNADQLGSLQASTYFNPQRDDSLTVFQDLDVTRDAGVGRDLTVAQHLHVDSNLWVTGKITPSYGAGGGIQFPADPSGGTGDGAWLTYEPGDGDEGTQLKLGISNDNTDDPPNHDNLVLQASGNIELHSPTIFSKLEGQPAKRAFVVDAYHRSNDKGHNFETGYLVSEYVAMVVGFDCGYGDVDETDSHSLWNVMAYEGDPYWMIRVESPTHNNYPDWTVHVLYIHRSFCDERREHWGSDNDTND